MGEPFNKSVLRPGDGILYRPVDVFDYAVALKTWTRVSHCEVYIGGGYSVASRNGKGVNSYPVRLDDVAAVRRPGPQFNFGAALDWFFDVQGQKYGWKTLLTFVMLNNNPVDGHMICSEFFTGFFKAGRNPLFSPDWPDYRTPPSLLLCTPALSTIWDDGRLF